jgi:adenylate cyclase
MKPTNAKQRRIRVWWSGGIAASLAALAGLCLFLFPLGGGITRLSFDLPFALRGNQAITNAAIIYLDEESHRELNQPLLAPWDRSLHARLIDQLTAADAKAIVFDILFTEPSAEPAADERLARAIERSRRVILAANWQEVEPIPGGPVGRREELPYEPFRKAAAGWGNANLIFDPDYGIRRFFHSTQNISDIAFIPWLPGAAARFAGAPENVIHSEGKESRWFNYYGPPRSFPSCSYFQALLPDGVPPGFFKDKIVFIGAQLSADFSGKGKDEFLTPYAFWGKGFASGVEIQATATLNLLRGDWLNRLPHTAELSLLLFVAVVAGFGLMRLQSLAAVLVTLAAVGLVVATANYLVWHYHLWFAWLIVPSELGVALLCSIVYNSLRLYVEKKLLEESLGAHLSPKVVKRMLNDPALRKPGGAQMEVSIMFTDIANFSRVSESMASDDLVRMMNRYFQASLECIHETDGTVVKLIGDAIFAIWNAPLAQGDHRERACRTASLLQERIVDFDAAHLSVPLRTRVGLHAGVASVGNIGSTHRFDYTALGENINLTSRLEGLNKFLGTSVLATRDVQVAVESSLLWRPVGHFRFKGTGRTVEVFELIGTMERAGPTREWRDKFGEGMHDFRHRRFEAAMKKFRQTIELRRAVEPEFTTGTGRLTADGPSRFYLDRAREFSIHPPPSDWIGEVALEEK